MSMLRVIIGAFSVLHGLVHLLYFGQSQRIFELQPGLAWPDGSWAFSKLFGLESSRIIASISLVIVALLFLVGGFGIFIKQAWWRAVVIISASLSTIIYLLFWDGNLNKFDQKGGVGILINLVILTSVLIFHWPEFDF